MIKLIAAESGICTSQENNRKTLVIVYSNLQNLPGKLSSKILTCQGNIFTKNFGSNKKHFLQKKGMNIHPLFYSTTKKLHELFFIFFVIMTAHTDDGMKGIMKCR